MMAFIQKKLMIRSVSPMNYTLHPDIYRIGRSIPRLPNITAVWNITVPNAGGNGFNPGLIVLIIVLGLLLVFFVGNYLLYQYAQRVLPPKKKKPVSKKKLKKEKRKQGVSIPAQWI